jgi:hypothetical protein
MSKTFTTIEMIGQRYGRVEVMDCWRDSERRLTWVLCRCDCGREPVTQAASVKRGNTTSCGCRKRSVLSENSVTHGQSGTPAWNSWRKMKGRCYDVRNNRYSSHGGRGIVVCHGWRNSFESFLADMGPKPAWATGGIDRIDNNGNYSCGHCDECLASGWPMNTRWATSSQQARNRRPRRATAKHKVIQLQGGE